MTWEDLRGKPKFSEAAAEFVEFARGAEWVIHNAPFDVGFLDTEFALARMSACRDVYGRLVDTLALARETFPGKRNNLDALCERFGIDNAHRTMHGALLDAELLAEVYLAMTRGQETLTIDLGAGSGGEGNGGGARGADAGPRPELRVIAPTPDEAAAHVAYLAALDKDTRGRCVWRALEAPDAAPA
jgi:DNA polymerase-3 subunit epsilon